MLTCSRESSWPLNSTMSTALSSNHKRVSKSPTRYSDSEEMTEKERRLVKTLTENKKTTTKDAAPSLKRKHASTCDDTSNSGCPISNKKQKGDEKQEVAVRTFKHKPALQMSKYTSQLEYIEHSLMPALWKHEYSWPFQTPVASQNLNLPDYDDIIKCPMDLGTIKRRFSQKFYKNAKECLRDLDLVFANCYTYNKPGADVWRMCQKLERTYMQKLALMPQEIKCQPEMQVGMKLEAEDKENDQVCCASIGEICEDYVCITFDGWGNEYDLWCHPWNPDLHPVGWCQDNGIPLSPPPTWKKISSFTWEAYMKQKKALPLPANALKPNIEPFGFAVGWKLEAEDKLNNLVCCATVVEIKGVDLRIHYDGWEEEFDFWCHVYSPVIHWVGWCKDNDVALSPPKNWKNVEEFTWDSYLKKTHTLAVPKAAFDDRKRCLFQEALKPKGPYEVKALDVVKVSKTPTPVYRNIKKQNKPLSSSDLEDLSDTDTASSTSSVLRQHLVSPVTSSKQHSPLKRLSNNSMSSPFTDSKIYLSGVLSPAKSKAVPIKPLGIVKNVHIKAVNSPALSPVGISASAQVSSNIHPNHAFQAASKHLENPIPQPLFPPDIVYDKNNEPVFKTSLAQTSTTKTSMTKVNSNSKLKPAILRKHVNITTDSNRSLLLLKHELQKPSAFSELRSSPLFSQAVQETSKGTVSNEDPSPTVIAPIKIEPAPEMRVTERIDSVLQNIQMLSESDVRNIIQIASSRLKPDTQIDVAQMLMRWNHDVLHHVTQCPCMSYKPGQNSTK